MVTRLRERVREVLILDFPNKKGVTRRQELHKVYEQAGHWHDDLNEIELTLEEEAVFELFWEFKRGEVQAITHQDINAYNQIRGENIDHVAMQLLFSMDNVYIEFMNAKMREDTK